MSEEVFQAKPPAASEPVNFQEKYFLVIDDVASMCASLGANVSTLAAAMTASSLGGVVFTLLLP